MKKIKLYNMTHCGLKTVAILIILSLVISVLVSGRSETAFNASVDGIVLAGRNMDSGPYKNFVAFLPAENDRFGRCFFGYYEYPNWYQGGMNDKGLMFAYNSAPYLDIMDSLSKPFYLGNYGNLMELCMETCSSVEEVLDIFDYYNLEFLENLQLMVVDRFGDSVIIEGDEIIHKEDNYQVITNFLHSNPDLGEYPCWRYDTAVQMLDEMTDLSVDYFTRICDATHQEDRYPFTIWSIVYDLNNLDIYLYNFNDYDNVIILNLIDELELGEHIYTINYLFEPLDNKPPEKPPQPKGPRFGKVGQLFDYNLGTITDPDNDEFYIIVDWYCDGIHGIWCDGVYTSGQSVMADKSWEAEGNYEIRARAVDKYGALSEWSDPLSISIAKNKVMNSGFFELIKNHPFLFPLLRLFFNDLEVNI